MSKKNYLIGVDVGATKIIAGVVKNNKIEKRIKILTETQKGKKVVLENIEQAIKEVWQRGVKSIGVAFTGQIDQKNGVVVTSPNFPADFKKVKVKKFLEKKFKRPVFLENDANCLTLAESILGAAKKHKYVVGLTLGSGIGSGMVFEGKIFNGYQGIASEWGHTTIIDDGLRCSCNQVGHLETYASGLAMTKLYKKFTGKDQDTFYIEKQVLKGNKAAKQVFKIMSESLGIGIANIINAINPSIIVIGGGLVRVKILWQPAIKIARKKVVYPSLKKTKIVKARLGDDAGILGATLIIEDKK